MLELPGDSPVPIIDPLVSLDAVGDGAPASVPRAALRDEQSLASWPNDATAHVFKKDPDRARRQEIFSDLELWLANLDRWRIARAQTVVPSGAPNDVFDRLSDHADRVFISVRVDPHEGMAAVRRLAELAQRYPSVLRSVSVTPCLTYPLIAPNSKEYYPIYAKCVEADLAVFVNVGFPGPRVPAWAQDPIHLDEVCWFFPDLRVVMRHGGDPWAETCVRMLLRWPNLYYATTAFAPRFLPDCIIDLLNGRGSRKVMWAGYFPTLSYARGLSGDGGTPHQR